MQHVWVNHDTDLLDVTLHSADSAHLTAETSETKQHAVALRVPPDDQVDLARRGAITATTAGSAAPDETVHTTASHSWLTMDRRWVPAGDLHTGNSNVTHALYASYAGLGRLLWRVATH